jgi:uncharacterized protein
MLKFLVLIGLLALLFYMLGLKRARPPQAGKPEAAPPARPQAMVSCAECGLHLPQQEALPGRGGQFCSAAHRAAFEARNPPPA